MITVRSDARSRKATRALCVAAAAAGLVCGEARAQEVTFEGSAYNIASRTTTLRVPASGTFNLRAVAGAYVTVGIAISGSEHMVTSVNWVSAGPPAGSQPLARVSGRSADDAPGCRAEMWGMAGPTPGAGYATVTLATWSGSPASAPSLGATLMAYGNVGATSTLGTCCMFIANDGSGTTTVTKTFTDSSRGDYLADSVCIAWSGADPGMPVADYLGNPVLVARAVELVRFPNLYMVAGTSPGADVARPATDYRHMRYVVSGQRTWGKTGVILIPALGAPLPDAGPPPPPDAALPPDAPAPPPDAAPIPDAPVPVPDAATPVTDSAAPPSDASPAADATAADQASGGGRDGSPASEAGGVGDAIARTLDLSVGCSCHVGRVADPGSSPMALLGALAAVSLGRRRLRRPRRRPPGAG